MTQIRWLVLFFVAAALIACRETGYTVPSAGMEPFIKMGDKVDIDKSYYSNHKPERFDVVAVRKEQDHKDTVLVKRVIALGNETIELRHGSVLVNGQKLYEPFAVISADQDFGPAAVPDGEYFLLGDNRPESYDSRFWKPPTIRRSDIVGKISNVVHK